MLGTVNGANFTDGLDGLASSVTVLIATYFTVAALGMQQDGMSAGIWPISCATVGSLLGFLVFNVYPARVFMGDTGSLALGICSGNRTYIAFAAVYPDRSVDLYG